MNFAESFSDYHHVIHPPRPCLKIQYCVQGVDRKERNTQQAVRVPQDIFQRYWIAKLQMLQQHREM